MGDQHEGALMAESNAGGPELTRVGIVISVVGGQGTRLRPDRLLERLEKFVRANLGNPALSISGAADELSMSVRTLQRRLTERQTSFREQVDIVRFAAVVRLLPHYYDYSSLAVAVGLSDAPALHRAFRRWTGMTMTEYRHRHWGASR